ncbi:MAG: S8 family serine peptidase [Anaerolineae bacterium]
MRIERRLSLLLATLLVAQVGASTALGQGRGDLGAELQSLGARPTVRYDGDTGLVRFYSSGVAAASLGDGGALSASTADAFLQRYGSLFGLDGGSDVSLTGASYVGNRAIVRYRQEYQSVPVIGGELVVQVAGGVVLSANGEVAPVTGVSTQPSLAADAATGVAVAAVAKATGLAAETLTATAPELWLYCPVLVGPGPDTTSLVWRLEVTSSERMDLRQLVLVDAHLGVVALQFNQVDTALDLAVYDAHSTSDLPGTTVVCTEAGCDPVVTDDARLALEYITDTYDYYQSVHGRAGLDGADSQIVATVRYCESGACPYDNAFWSGSQMVFGANLVIDDVVAHELTHGVTQYESGLMYLFQSGAINEALSDFWGEMVDQGNGAGDDSDGVRWLLGEEYSGGAFRSMADPPDYGDPDTMASGYYDCDADLLDNGGVHSNSGVLNKAAYLMVDGGTFNGVSVAALGATKTARVMYELQTHLLTSASGYSDVYNLLPQACTNLQDGVAITAADCAEVAKAVQATQMDQQPGACAVPADAACPGGQCTDLFFDDFEVDRGVWAEQDLFGGGVQWYYPQNTHSYPDWDATYATSGIYNLWGDDSEAQSDSAIAMTTSVALPAGQAAYLHFRHAFAFEVAQSWFDTYICDGGVVEYSVDSGASWHDVSTLANSEVDYTGTLTSSNGPPDDNPLVGRSAYVGSSGGYWATRINITALAGKSVRFRFRLGTDYLGANYGWFIDDVRILTAGSGGTVAGTTKRFIPLASRAYTPYPTVGNSNPNDPRYASQWGLAAVRAPSAWQMTVGVNGPIIAILDTGASLGHTDLAANLVPGYDFANGDATPDDDQGHGSHVAGIIGAVGNNGVGVVGMNWAARIMPLKVLDSEGSGYASDLQDAIHYAVDHGAKVINMSLGSDYPSPYVQEGVSYALQHGCVVVAAAGNDKYTTQYPAAYDSVLGVGAVDSSRQVADFSYEGPYVDVVAPGVDVLSTVPGGYDSYDGTSMATPHVSGLAALIWAVNPSLTGTQVAARITGTAQDLGSAGWDSAYGYGLIDAGAAVAGGTAATSSRPVMVQSQQIPATLVPGSYRPGSVLVQLEGDAGTESLSTLSAQGILGAQAASAYIPGLVRVTVPEGQELEAMRLLSQQPGVRAVYVDATIHAM